MHRFGKLVDAGAVRLNRMRGAGGLGDLLLGDVHADIFEQHLQYSRTAVIFGDLLDPS